MTEKHERFTKHARQVLQLAQAEAMRLQHNSISPEHLLVGLARDTNGLAQKVLAQLGVDPHHIVLAVEQAVGRGERASYGKPTLAPSTQKVIELALDEVGQRGHKHIGTEHILLGLIREGENLGARLLSVFVDLERVRTQLAEIFAHGQSDDPDPWDAVVLQMLMMTRASTEAAFSRASTEAAVQAERSRLARDLHDSIKQQLFSISVSAAAVRERWEKDPPGARAALDDVQHSARAALVEMDALLKQLRPNPLETAGLIEALREQCEALAFRTGAEVTSYFDELPAEECLPEATHATLFRIAQEALANIARHARANQVHMRVEHDLPANLLRLVVRDNGQGFDPHTVTTGMGMTNMTQRAQSLQGRVVVESTPGQGTTIQVEIPLLQENLP